MSSSFQKCRLCLKLGDFCSIFEQDDSIKLSDMVMSFTTVRIYEGDGFSDRVCTSCIENLSTAYLFKQQCERIDQMLRKYPETDINKPADNYEDFFNKEFHMHAEFEESENDKNDCANDVTQELYVTAKQETSDETDSDVDSVKCVGCSQSYSTIGYHTCRTTCTIENNPFQHCSSNETLVASDVTNDSIVSKAMPPLPIMNSNPLSIFVSCVLCDNKFDRYDDYVIHLNKCTTNVKLHHYVCPVCHEMFTEKLFYLEHIKTNHFKEITYDTGMDCIDFPIYAKVSKQKPVRRQIGWSTEDIYQEIDCKKSEDKNTPQSSPLKNFFSKLGNE